MERLWNHLFFNELKAEPENHSVILTEAPLCPTKEREKAAEVLFEAFRIPALYIAATSVLALYSSGRTTGLVVDSGQDVTWTVPIFEGYKLGRHIEKSPIAGGALTRYLGSLLAARGYILSTPRELDLLNGLKESVCYVAADYERAAAQTTKEGLTPYALPDGQEVLLCAEPVMCPELLFDPSRAGADPTPAIGVDRMCVGSIGQCDPEIQGELYGHVVLAGGTTLFRGLGGADPGGCPGALPKRSPQRAPRPN
eukprot:TRINITY_DN11675_c0_g1_i1.p1 TRINITY_DN11675_c0_g1~~TRINITY_DN11675_c0_g1_i1.p1  ORF type:complete len:254 (+),score=45.95 TRINITY_DN11675_c0_g1_i1:188-949(+)